MRLQLRTQRDNAMSHHHVLPHYDVMAHCDVTIHNGATPHHDGTSYCDTMPHWYLSKLQCRNFPEACQEFATSIVLVFTKSSHHQETPFRPRNSYYSPGIVSDGAEVVCESQEKTLIYPMLQTLKNITYPPTGH